MRQRGSAAPIPRNQHEEALPRVGPLTDRVGWSGRVSDVSRFYRLTEMVGAPMGVSSTPLAWRGEFRATNPVH